MIGIGSIVMVVRTRRASCDWGGVGVLERRRWWTGLKSWTCIIISRQPPEIE